MLDCIFCKIIAGKIPSLKIYENDHVLSFLDIGPLADGHTLVIPKKHYTFLHEMTDPDLGEIVKALPRIAQAVMAATGTEAYNVLQNNGRTAGQLVDHVHFHIIPRVDADGLGYRWNAKKYPEGKDKKIQQAIIAELR
jgi:histidine triad (HIT) family protein